MKEITENTPGHNVTDSSKTEKTETSARKRESSRLPKHVAIIMDGNGRWAKQRKLPRFKGHEYGAKNIRPVIEYLIYDHGIKFVTLYGFSTEN